MFSLFQYISAFLVLALGASLYYIDIQADKIVSLRSDLAIQNKAVQDLGDEYAERVVEFHNKKPKVLTRYIKTYITKDINTSRSSCEEVNTIFDNIRHIGL